MPMHKHGAVCDIEEKALSESDDCWTFTGYASIFNTKDQGNDVVVPGAFIKSLRDHGLPLILWQHKHDDVPVGTCLDAKEDKRGLWIKGELPKDDAFVSGRLVPQLKRRGLRGMSIGYRPLESEKRKSDGVRLLKQVRLYECSFVSMPMHPDAGLESIKGITTYQDLRIDKMAKGWDAGAAFKRLQERYGDDADLRQAFLFVDEEKAPAEWDLRMLIADVDDKGELVANHIALYKAVAAIAGARKGVTGSVKLPEVAGEAVEDHLARYYSRMNFEAPPLKFLGVDEFDALDVDERHSRLRVVGISRKLADRFVQASAAPSAEQQSPGGKPEAISEQLSALASAMTEFVAVATTLSTRANPDATGRQA